MSSISRIAQAFAGIGLHPNRARSMIDMAKADPLLASRIADAISVGDDAALRRIAAEAQWSVSPAATPTQAPATPRLDPPGKPSIEAQQQRIAAEEAAMQPPVAPEQAAMEPPVAPDRTYPTPDFQMDLTPSRPVDGPIEFSPDPARRELSAAEDISPNTTASDPPASWADDPDAPGYVAPQSADPAFDDFINRLGDQSRPRRPTLADNARQAGGEMWDRAMRAGRGGMDNARARINAMPPGLLPAAGLGIAGLGAGIYMANQAGPSQGSAATPASPPVPNIIQPPKPMSTADLAAQTRPPPSVTTPQSPRDQAMQMIDDLNARRRAAGGEVPDAPQTMQKVNRLLAMSNEQSAAASRGDIPVQGNGPREQAQRILAQLNAMRQQAGGEVPQAGQMMAEVQRLQAMSDQQANARRAG